MATKELPTDSAVGGIDWILNPQINFNEADTGAAEAAVAGGFAGSPFATVNNLRLRDSERMERIKLGNELLNPFLDRQNSLLLENVRQAGETGRLNTSIGAQRQNLNTQIAADAARQAVEQAGLDRRLGSEAASRLQLALLEGDQQAARQLVTEAGATGRQAAEIAANLRVAQMNAQNNLLSTLISSGARQGAATADPYGRTRVAPPGTSNIGTGSTVPGFGAGFSLYPDRSGQTPAPAATTGGGSATNRYTGYINQILRNYGLS